MVKQILLTATLLFFFGALSSANAQGTAKQVTAEATKANFKFLDDISVDPVMDEKPAELVRIAVPAAKRDLLTAAKAASDISIEAAGGLQFKYSLLLDVEVEILRNLNLLQLIEDWYGTRYSYGGTSKRGIDCSALMQVFFASLYGISLPRTARMQYDNTRRISRTELKEGDLIFFNTTGGVSHVGMYLMNNKFVHASSSNGVTISDMFDPYYASRLVGVGRVQEEEGLAQSVASPKP